MPKTLSVVMPHYNHGRFVSTAVRALLTQSRPPDELILVDDASTDGSGPVLDELARDPRVRLVRHEKNAGCAASIATGLALASGDWVFAPAADDFVLPGFFEKSLALLEKNPSAGFSSTLAGIAAEDGTDLGAYPTAVVRDRPSYLGPAEFLAEHRRVGGLWVTSPSVIYRRDAILEAGGWLVELNPTVDGYLVHALGSRYGMVFVPERLVMWRRLENSLGYSLGNDAVKTVALTERLDRRLAEYGVPADHRAFLFDECLRLTLDTMTRRDPFPTEEAALVASKAVRGRALAALYRGALALGGGRRATKLFVFLRMPAAERSRIAAGKALRAFGGGAAR